MTRENTLKKVKAVYDQYSGVGVDEDYMLQEIIDVILNEVYTIADNVRGDQSSDSAINAIDCTTEEIEKQLRSNP